MKKFNFEFEVNFKIFEIGSLMGPIKSNWNKNNEKSFIVKLTIYLHIWLVLYNNCNYFKVPTFTLNIEWVVMIMKICKLHSSASVVTFIKSNMILIIYDFKAMSGCNLLFPSNEPSVIFSYILTFSKPNFGIHFLTLRWIDI